MPFFQHSKLFELFGFVVTLFLYFFKKFLTNSNRFISEFIISHTALQFYLIDVNNR